jgi:CRISPR-associated exonuclease Cas4
MTHAAQDRLISASEIERWCYCPLSWKLERSGDQRHREDLSLGEERHKDIGRQANGVKTAQTKAKQDRRITWAFLAFSVVLLLMGISLVVLTQVGSIDIGIWRIGVVILSVIMIGASIAYYFGSRSGKEGEPEESIRRFLGDMDRKELPRASNPALMYLYGIILMVNGIVLMRPFKMSDDLVGSVLAVSLLLLYIIMLLSVTLYFRSHRKEIRKGDVKIGLPLTIMLLISLSVLFIFISDEIDPRGDFGWVFLLLSLVWFIGAIGYDLYTRLKTGRPKSGRQEKGDLRIAALALLASVFTASTFLAKGDNLDEYYFASVVIAGAWLIGALFFFWRGAHQRKVAENGIEELSLPKGAEMVTVDDIGNRKGTKPLTSKRHYLVGAPDLVIEENGKKVPVEMKTGRIPVKPHFSHVMQLAAYLVLMDVNYDQETPYGYLEYSPSKKERKRFKVDWDLMTKALVLSKVSEIRESERTGVVHRNHHREGKCRGCSRRQGCPERLV